MFPAVCLSLMVYSDLEAIEAIFREEGVAYVGLTEAEVLKKLGAPTAKEKDVWEYREPLRGIPGGCIDHRVLRRIQFEKGKVVSAARIREGIG
jgi:hypothetical protein